MMDRIRELFSEEISFLEELTAYETDLVPFETAEDALTTLFQWIEDGIDVPDRLIADGPLFVLWNMFIAPVK